ncbi:unnamed protein product, partial [Rotaria socialis]
ASSSSSVRPKEEKICLHSASSNENSILTQNKMYTASNRTDEEDSSTVPNHTEENPMNKSFKRKVVSFSAMPCEKKVAD